MYYIVYIYIRFIPTPLGPLASLDSCDIRSWLLGFPVALRWVVLFTVSSLGLGFRVLGPTTGMVYTFGAQIPAKYLP